MSETEHIRRNLVGLSVALCLIFAVHAGADDYSAGWGPAVGTAMPTLAAPDQTGTERRLADLSGDQGLLLFLNRSADW